MTKKAWLRVQIRLSQRYARLTRENDDLWRALERRETETLQRVHARFFGAPLRRYEANKPLFPREKRAKT